MNQKQFSSLENLVIVFAHALAGLGHLRVISALHEGLVPEADVILLGSHDKAIQNIHRLTSTNPVTKLIYSWMQSGPLQNQFAFYYKRFLKLNSKLLYEQLTTIMEQRIKQPKKVLVVAAHFGLAHQLVEVKEKVEKEKNIKIYLVVQVTDATFHPMWYVDGAEMLIAPSVESKEQLVEFGKKFKLKEPRIEVLPYPVNPKFFINLTSEELQDRNNQLEVGTTPINVSIPVSGAAVGTNFHKNIIHELNRLDPRFVFWVVSKKAKYTTKFLKDLSNLAHVRLFSSESEREVVDDYDNLFDKAVFSLEITKPSEQAFKALVSTVSKAGVILLFTSPVGHQEEDNLNFLLKHALMPTKEQTEKLWNDALEVKDVDPEILKVSSGWRGLTLPADAKKAASFIVWCHKQKIFQNMNHFKKEESYIDPNPEELAPDGVIQFWNLVTEYINTN